MRVGMGRLFWKFFFFIWLVQVLGMFGIGFSFWLRHHEHAHVGDMQVIRPLPPADTPSALDTRPSKQTPPPQPTHGRGMPPPPHGLHLLPPLELVIANLLGGLLCAALLAWYFSKPIRELRHAFDHAAEGRLDARLKHSMGKRRDELADLGHDFDRMAERLQKLVNNQRHLLHDVSHELRSPLARLQAAIGLIRQRPEKLEATLDRIELESSRIDHLVGELLTLSRLETDVIGGQQEEFSLGELVTEIVDDARFEAEMQGKAIDFTGDCDCVVRGRAELLGRAIENVVRNAIKYTPQGSWVLVKSDYDPGNQRLVLSVRDHGPGIPEEDVERIFEPFFRSRNGNGTEGYGLGLAIARRVMQSHGGSISARNNASGGLCVEMIFPFCGHQNRSEMPNHSATPVTH